MRTPIVNRGARERPSGSAGASAGLGYASVMMVRERRALTTVVLGFYAFLWATLSLVPDTGAQAFFASMAVFYGASLFALVAGYFWARWFARGVGWWGTFAGVYIVLQAGPHPIFLFFAGTHAAILLLTAGEAMAARFEGRDEWRARYGLDDEGVKKIGNTVTNVASMLPYLAIFAFRPRYEGLAELTVPLALALAFVGTWGLVRLRTWGVLAIGAAGALFLSSVPGMESAGGLPAVGAWLVGALLVASVLRFAPGIVRFMRA